MGDGSMTTLTIADPEKEGIRENENFEHLKSRHVNMKVYYTIFVACMTKGFRNIFFVLKKVYDWSHY